MRAQEMLVDVLRGVSRSFYITLQVLPASVRQPIGLGYLLARAADTIADSEQVPAAVRRELLNKFRDQVQGSRDDSGLAAISRAFMGSVENAKEQVLLDNLPICFDLLDRQRPHDQVHLRKLLDTLTEGMLWDLELFTGSSAGQLRALGTIEDLDRYTYYVAGCVGGFWTDLSIDNLPLLRSWDRAHMREIGIRYGKGLQLINVLQDLSSDLQRGRCYLPTSELEKLGLIPADLLEQQNATRLRPLITDLVSRSRDHLDAGWEWLRGIPDRHLRIRLATLLPLIIGLRTLERIASNPTPLDPDHRPKIRRKEIYRIQLQLLARLISFRLLDPYRARLRDTVSAAL